MVALIYVVKWQKRGPPHAHILMIADATCKPKTSEVYDSIVCAKIADKKNFLGLHRLVTTLMMHGPCGSGNANSPCMVDGKCSKNFPKDFIESIVADSDGCPRYRRRNDGRHVVDGGVTLDNRHVVPYNPYLSLKYNAHINVEICSNIKACKYLSKYVYKGPDMASVALTSASNEDSKKEPVDEIRKFVNSRFNTAPEGM